MPRSAPRLRRGRCARRLSPRRRARARRALPVAPSRPSRVPIGATSVNVGSGSRVARAAVQAVEAGERVADAEDARLGLPPAGERGFISRAARTSRRKACRRSTSSASVTQAPQCSQNAYHSGHRVKASAHGGSQGSGGRRTGAGRARGRRRGARYPSGARAVGCAKKRTVHGQEAARRRRRAPRASSGIRDSRGSSHHRKLKPLVPVRRHAILSVLLGDVLRIRGALLNLLAREMASGCDKHYANRNRDRTK